MFLSLYESGHISYIILKPIPYVVSFENLMHKAIQEVLATIGEPTRQALHRQLRQDGIMYSAERVDLPAIESKLRQFFGIGSPVIIEMIYDSFISKAIQSGCISPDACDKLDVDRDTLKAIWQCPERKARKTI